MHADADGHDTSNNPLIDAPGALGVDTTLHALPFQCSASVTNTPELTRRVPTATHQAPDEHDAPKNWPARPAGFAVAAIDQPAADAAGALVSDPVSSTPT